MAPVPVPNPKREPLTDTTIENIENIAPRPREKPDSEILEKIAEEINSDPRIFNTVMSFSIDDATGQTVIKILDRDSEKVIREIPLSEMLKLAAKLADIIGRIVDETV
ncbi:flagellar protein FlaG [candidate division KSB1 bacterium]|nr:flagellar protein FlaG [candidate division KSB1 bacterium]